VSDSERIDELDGRVRDVEGEVGRIPVDLDPRLRGLEGDMRDVKGSTERMEKLMALSADPDARARSCPQNTLMTQISERLAQGNQLFTDIRTWQTNHDTLHKDTKGLGGVVARIDALERDFRRLLKAGWWVLAIFLVSLLQRIVPRFWTAVAEAILGG
jgi:hypothetical protein